MKPTARESKEFRDLLGLIRDGQIRPEQEERLDQLLGLYPSLQQDYIEYMLLCEALHSYQSLAAQDYSTWPRESFASEPIGWIWEEAFWRAMADYEKTSPAVPVERPAEQRELHPPRRPGPAERRKVKRTPLVVALSLLLGFLIFVVSVSYLQGPAEEAVAVLTDAMGARWSDAADAMKLGGEFFNTDSTRSLLSGFINIQFYRGPRILIEGPARFTLPDADRIVLHAGRIYVKVPPQATGFIVDTPNARIVDLGTEFGIEVDKAGTSDVQMFKGTATLIAGRKSKTGESRLLFAGQAKRVDIGGRVRDIPIKKQAFVRHFYSHTGFIWRGQRLCLTDIVGEGNGLGTGQTNVYVDPVEGYKESLYCDGEGNEYHTLASNSFIDGLFIPDGSKRQIVSSQAHEFKDCPKTNGECYATLAANPDQGLYYDGVNNLIMRVVDPSVQGTPAFILADETYVVTGTEAGVELMPDGWSENRLGTGTWVHFRLGTPVPLAANRQYGFDVTVPLGNRGFCLETAGIIKDSYAGGSAYSTGTKGGTNSLHLDEVYGGDHTFVVELAQTGPIEPTQGGPKVSYSAKAPDIGPDDVCFLGESTIDNKNVGGFPGQVYSGDNDHATYIAQDRRGLGQTFTTGSHPSGYLMKGFWLKNVRYTENLSGGNGTWWYVGATQRRNSIIRFNGQNYGDQNHPCIVMHANLGITFDLSAIRTMCPDIKITHFVSQFGIADFEEQVGCNADFWVLVDGQVRESRRHVTQKNVLGTVSIELSPSDRFLTLVTTDGGDIDRMGAYQRSFTCDWCVFVEPALILETEEGTVNMQAR